MRKTLPLVGLGFFLAACGSDDNVTNVISGDGGASKPLVSTTSTAANSTCPAGGVTVSIGFDTNGNGTLDPGEVTSSQEICGATAGASDGGNVAGRVLTSLTTSSDDDMCANGGYVLSSGADTNGNGVLDPGEVTSEQEICNGAASNVLSITTILPAGDPNCPLGGKEIQSGTDNGAGDGGAGDGILEPGEITSTTYICGSTGTDAGNGSFAPPAPVMNQPAYTFKATGGTGSTGRGGNGGAVEMILDGSGSGNGGASINIFTTGMATATATAPTATPMFGATALDVTANTTLALHANATDAMDGEYYFLAGKLVHRVSAAETNDAVTGLHVAAGVTLTWSLTTAMTALPGDISIEGTVTGATAGQSVDLETSGTFVTSAASQITTVGAAATATTAATTGGKLSVKAGTLILNGTIDVSGGAGLATTAGASSGALTLQSTATAYAAGTLRANGGAGGTSSGNGGAISLVGASSLSSAATVTSTGGDAMANAAAGAGSTVQLACTTGACVLTSAGSITANGGNAAATCTGACNGGAGGALTVSVGASFATAANFTAKGGTGAGTGAGGSGGACTFVRSFLSSVVSAMQVSGNVDLSGGNGATGGGAGTFELEDGDAYTGGTNDANFYGLSSISLNGGDGATGGGNGGTVQLVNGNGQGITALGDGNVLLYTPVSAVGGKALTSGTGGPGGTFLCEAGSRGVYDNMPAGFGQLVGTIDLSGNDGVSAGGSAGYATIVGQGGIVTSAAITAKGGNGSAGSGGATDGAISFVSGNALVSSGTITATGGNGGGANAAGGNGAAITLQAAGALTNSAAIHSTGGTSQGVAGGAGGNISLTSSGTFTNTGAVTSTGGTGSTTGAAGTVTLN